MYFFNSFSILLIIFFKCWAKIIVLPFRSYIKTNILEEKEIFDNFFPKKIYTEVLIGDPPQCLNINLNPEGFAFYISPSECDQNFTSYYIHNKSKSFYLIFNEYIDDGFEFYDASYASDLFSFYNSTDLRTNISKNGFEFIYDSYIDKEYNTCALVGLGFKERVSEYNGDAFINSLKKKNLIKNYFWTYVYFNKDLKNNKILNFPEIDNQNIIKNYDGMIIIGNYTYEYNTFEYDEKYVASTLAAERNKNLKWDIIFKKIYLGENKNNINEKDVQADLSINYDYVVSPIEYFDKICLPFFNTYINEKICQIQEIKKSVYTFEVISCDKKLFTINDIKKFPTIYFYHFDFNFTFELNYNDLFEEINDKIFFLIVKNKGSFNQNLWKLGKIFLKKYLLSFNQDSKTISFYNNNNVKNDDNSSSSPAKEEKKFNKDYIWIIICVICLALGIYIGTKIIVKNRKKRANELQDDYDYKIEKENNKKKDLLTGENFDANSGI